MADHLDFFDESLKEIDLGLGFSLEYVVEFLKKHGAEYHGETWFPDLQYDEFELEGETIWVVQETYMDLIIKGRPEYIEELRVRITKWIKKKRKE